MEAVHSSLVQADLATAVHDISDGGLAACLSEMGRKAEAIAAVPNEFVDQGALIGPEARIRKRFRDWEDVNLSGLTVSGDEQAIRFIAECARLNFAAE